MVEIPTTQAVTFVTFLQGTFILLITKLRRDERRFDQDSIPFLRNENDLAIGLDNFKSLAANYDIPCLKEFERKNQPAIKLAILIEKIKAELKSLVYLSKLSGFEEDVSEKADCLVADCQTAINDCHGYISIIKAAESGEDVGDRVVQLFD